MVSDDDATTVHALCKYKYALTVFFYVNVQNKHDLYRCNYFNVQRGRKCWHTYGDVTERSELSSRTRVNLESIYADN